MKAVILAGGLGTRFSEETHLRPKPMIEIGGKPILWHIMKIYATHNITEFIIALGYKAEIIKEYFLNFYSLNNDISIDLATGKTTIHDGKQPNWKIHLVDTGIHTQIGGRLKRLKSWVDESEHFLFMYGDGVADLNIESVLKFHFSHRKCATVTTVRSPAWFSSVVFEENRISNFYEKLESGEWWINGGFFVLHPKVIDYIDGDGTPWEKKPLERLTREGHK